MNTAMVDWFSLDDLAGWSLPGYRVSRRRLAVLVRDQSWREQRDRRLGALARRRPGKGGGWEYHRSLLSATAQRVLAERNTAPVGETEQAEGRFVGGTVIQQNQAEAKAAIVRAADRFHGQQNLSILAADSAFCRLYSAGTADMPDWVGEVLPSISPGSLGRWRKKLRKGGLDALIGRQGRHRRGGGLIDSQAAIGDLVKGMLAAHPHAGAGHIMQALRTRFGSAEGIKLPSVRNLQRWLADWKAKNPHLHTHLVNPDKARSHFLTAVGNASQHVVRLNQLWELDSSPGDIILADGTRHALIGTIDVYSRRLRLHLARTSSAAGIAAVMRKAILDWGVPERVIRDNGNDYKSRHMERIFDNLGIDVKTCTRFSPQQKPHIERAFKTFNHDLVELLPGFTGHSVAERQGVRGRKNETAVKLNAAEFQQFCDKWCDQVYAHNGHGGLNGQTPFAKAAEFTGPVRKIENERALDIALMPPPTGSEWRVVQKGKVVVDGGEYIHPDLAEYTGRRVRVALDEADFGAVYLFNLDGEFICRAEDAATLGAARKDVAVATKHRQKTILNQGLKELRQTARRVKPQNIAQEIIAGRGDQAGGLAAFPAPTQQHKSRGLSAAEAAARASGPKVIDRLSADEQAVADALFARLNGDEDASEKIIPFGGPVGGAPPNGHKSQDRPQFNDDSDFIKWALNAAEATQADRAYASELLEKSSTLRLLAASG